MGIARAGSAVLVLLGLAGCASSGADSALAAALKPPAASRENGTLASLDPILRTERSEYFALTYWSDGLRVKGLLGRPRGSGPFPAVVYNHGGNREYGKLQGWDLIPLVEAGYVAAGSQYRGNAGGEGREEFGGADRADVTSLVTLLERLPGVDPDRIGMMGHSRGGMMTYLALREQTLRRSGSIKAAVVISGLADLVALAEARLEMFVLYEELIGKDEAQYRERSAVSWPELIDTPLLILHGEADERIPVEQARRLAASLAALGKPARLIVYPGDDHDLRAHQGGYPAAMEFLAQHLGKPGEDLSLEAHRKEVSETVRAWPR